jgi:hypothetical protein
MSSQAGPEQDLDHRVKRAYIYLLKTMMPKQTYQIKTILQTLLQRRPSRSILYLK